MLNIINNILYSNPLLKLNVKTKDEMDTNDTIVNIEKK